MSRTIAKAIQKLDGEVEVENFFAWLKTMMLNLRTDEMRRAVVRGTQPVESEQLESYAGADWSTDEQILKDSDSEAIRQAIAELDPKYRQAMLMRYYDDFSFKEIAQILNLPMGTVSRRIQIAHHLLASKLGAKLGRKPIALLAAALLGIGTLFGAWQVGLGEWVEELISSPQSEATQPEGTRHSCRVSQDESTASTTTDLTTKEEPPMNTIKGTLLAAATAVSLMSTAQADVADIKSRIVPAGVETTNLTADGTAFKYSLVEGGVEDVVAVFTGTDQQYTYTLPDDISSIRYLVVGGGGSGGGRVGGGGGAGGMIERFLQSIPAGASLKINVGAGGERVQSGDYAPVGHSGGDSSISNGVLQIALAYGGGGGGSDLDSEVGAPLSGGSGGGANGTSKTRKVNPGAAPIDASQGYAGGDNSSTTGTANLGAGSGGGGAGSAGKSGGNGNSSVWGGAGGVGKISDITDIPLFYAAGGGGANPAQYSDNGGAGGSGIGGKGGYGVSGNAAGAGLDGTGSGGGGGGYRSDGNAYSGKGGDGIVVIRYTRGEMGQNVRANDGYTILLGDEIAMVYTNCWHAHTFTIPKGVEFIRYLVVGGGGAGGDAGDGSGGGGGAGGMLTGEGVTVETGNVLTIMVGAGGVGTTDLAGNDGGASSLALGSTIIACADGGGGGGSVKDGVGAKSAHKGGSGGGGNGSTSKARAIGAGAPAKLTIDERPQGYAGGGEEKANTSYLSASGGGGAGGAGNPGGPSGGSSTGGDGGPGKTCDITGEDNVYYAGGGGGAAFDGNRTPGAGGSGIGGKGGKNSNGEDGKTATGSGGGGGSGSGKIGGNGGSGIVIIRCARAGDDDVTVNISSESEHVTYKATVSDNEIESGATVPKYTVVKVVATPAADYEFSPLPDGWSVGAEEGTIAQEFTADTDPLAITVPAANEIPFTMNFTPGANASYTATVDGQPVQNGAKIRTGKQIVVVATPNTDCEYAAIPEGWSAGEVEGTITRTITAGKDTPQLTIPDAAAIDYVQVQFTSNGSAFFEATNAVGEKVEGRVRAGTEVFVKIWAGVGFVYTETPTGWTPEAEGDAYTRAFTAVSGSTLTIQIPNAKEIGGKWTKEIPANIGYKLEVEKDLVFVFTNTAAEGCEMILPSGVTSLRYLVVGGGGAGGRGNGCCGGGGGAGGMLTNNEFKVIGRMLKINVGKGGVGADGCGADGKDSVLVNGAGVIRAFGGGGGGGGRNQSDIVSPNPGGSGGGGNGSVSNARKIFAGAAAMVAEDGRTQGHAGGGVAYDSQGAISASGGGGAGGKGGDGNYAGAGGNGGAGLLCDITGEDNKYYAAGGGGACYDGYKDGGTGGSGIGGNGGKDAAGDPGVDGTGSGGGGSRNNGASGKGGDGVVILRFKKPSNGIVIFIM